MCSNFGISWGEQLLRVFNRRGVISGGASRAGGLKVALEQIISIGWSRILTNKLLVFTLVKKFPQQFSLSLPHVTKMCQKLANFFRLYTIQPKCMVKYAKEKWLFITFSFMRDDIYPLNYFVQLKHLVGLVHVCTIYISSRIKAHQFWLPFILQPASIQLECKLHSIRNESTSTSHAMLCNNFMKECRMHFAMNHPFSPMVFKSPPTNKHRSPMLNLKFGLVVIVGRGLSITSWPGEQL